MDPPIITVVTENGDGEDNVAFEVKVSTGKPNLKINLEGKLKPCSDDLNS